MGKAILFGRLAAKDLRRHLSEGVLLFVVIAAACGHVDAWGWCCTVRPATPMTRPGTATTGPDVVANLSPTFSAQRLDHVQRRPRRSRGLGTCARGRRASAGRIPVTFALLKTHGVTTSAMLEGRDSAPAKLDSACARRPAAGSAPAGWSSSAASPTRSACVSGIAHPQRPALPGRGDRGRRGRAALPPRVRGSAGAT